MEDAKESPPPQDTGWSAKSNMEKGKGGKEQDESAPLIQDADEHQAQGNTLLQIARGIALLISFVAVVSLWALLENGMAYFAGSSETVRLMVYALVFVTCAVFIGVYRLVDTDYDALGPLLSST
uniref:Uncharacterized protein n=1 Tax=Chromera velia CCMP2878 TaxID=1169474 RepID=A0A0G4H4T9_9ALVE|eukprot:Cvel_24681.t1-p1 / transcript=Cvel_24681.t1 / gene=Cvel_24681 / organism=Chromera_velia_CCMP2878 / gene_product=hypothetical protein / transcript_product=hypothetical protein / location=Cvel_scaffold2703:5621-7380(-) / protein_length=123 / sequence_SO=supercontig / SO=protein_coding / is_pseudo=false